ncbi:uncharacterized protein LOC104585439 [Brachypodium distachyon]|nr:uncharacterized protein LOC104585439 [Brachypodium distachyon]XP_010240483.1 uncharacterized protein LOC104585439 [Brachypodium distachyon]XP_024312373.1 uncharacterized protein LOC104585439 [Brachypodium distachyon]|eukprot:XP_010240475.1 uncharacterized protein LOC104585439 [Brachypodium distachyon]
MTVCLWMLLSRDIIPNGMLGFQVPGSRVLVLVVSLVIVRMLGFYIFVGYISRKESHILLQLSPVAALLLSGVAMHYAELDYWLNWMGYTLIPQWTMIYILTRFGSPGNACPLHKEIKVAAQLFLVILFVATVLILLQQFGIMNFLVLLGPFVLGNLQIPLALARIMLSCWWLFYNKIEVQDTKNKNIKLAVKVLYIMVLCQGTLNMMACILESFSFLLRRSLALACGLVDNLGMKSVDLYYEKAYDTFLQESVFDVSKMDLVTFALNSLNSDAVSWGKKRAAVRILDSFLQRLKASSSITDLQNKELVSRITTSNKAVTTLISMLGWTLPKDEDIRLLAAKVAAHLAPYLRIVSISDTMQMVSSLLEAQDQPVIQDISSQVMDGNGGDTDQQSHGSGSPTVNGNSSSPRDIVGGNADQQSHGSGSPTVNSNSSLPRDTEGGNADQQSHGSGSPTVEGNSSLPLDIEGGAPAMQASSNQAERNSQRCSLFCKIFNFLKEGIRRFLRHVGRLRSIPHEDKIDKDSLPALGMQILEGLAHDLHNCEEISRATEILLPMIIGFISCTTGSTEQQRLKNATSSLTLIAKLASVKGKMGIALREELFENPFLLGNLAEILEGNSSSNLEQRKLTMNIIAELAMEKKTREKIGKIKDIIDKLVQEFIGEDESEKPLRGDAGEALAMLAMESPDNCSAMLHEPNQELLKDLANKLQRGEHIYQAASLLQSLCENSRQVLLLQDPGDSHLLSTLTVVLGRIVDAEGKQMEALIGLASQICSACPAERVARVLDLYRDGETLVRKLVRELDARKKPSPDESPNTRRLLFGLTVSILKLCPPYAVIFRGGRMMETLSGVEKYMVFFGSSGVVSEGLPALVARAKELIGG